MIVTVTYVRSTVLGRHVPVVISVSFQQMSLHYKPYFYVLIDNLEYSNYDDFMAIFQGNLCDFSKMERNGVRLAVFEMSGEHKMHDTDVHLPNVLTKPDNLEIKKSLQPVISITSVYQL